MQHIPTTRIDLDAYLLATLGNEHNGAPVRNVKPALPVPYRCIVIQSIPQNRPTPISRYVRLIVQGWDVRSNSTGNFGGALKLAGDYAAAVEALSGRGRVLVAEVESGPYRVTDPESGVEYAVANLLLEIA